VTLFGEGIQGCIEVDGVPVADRCGDEVEAGRTVALLVVGVVAELAESVEEHGAGERVACFSFVQARSGRPLSRSREGWQVSGQGGKRGDVLSNWSKDILRDRCC
jgi:hypothetical protein